MENLSEVAGRLKYLYVVGANYSGSTLLAYLLNAHSQMASIGEPGRMDNRQRTRMDWNLVMALRCSCGQRLLECPFFRQLEKKVREQGCSFSLSDWQVVFQTRRGLSHILLERPLPFDSLEYLRERALWTWPEYARAVDSIGRRVCCVARAVLEIAGKRVFVDAEKDPVRVGFLRRLTDLDLKVVHLIRDVRGAVTSFIKRPKRGLWPKWPLRSLDVAQAAVWWKFENMKADKARRLVPAESWLRVHYEDLCADTQGTIDAISDFVGVERCKVPSHFYATDHHILGNPRLRREGPSMISRDDLWKTTLSGSEVAIVARVAGKATRYFGYYWP